MHPAVIEWWKSRHSSGGECEAWAGGGGWGRRLREAAYYQASGGDDGEAGSFGVRRPLRFLAYKLDLDDRQVTELARILADLKTERAQAEVDRRRTLAAFADAIAADAFDHAGASAAGQRRVETAERLRDAVVTALERIHAVLDPEQRQKLAYLIRTGTLVI